MSLLPHFGKAAAVLGAGWLAVLPLSAAAETNELRIAQQFGVGYLPLQMADSKQLFQKHAREAGLGEIKVTWSQFGSGGPMNDAILSGHLDLASGSVGPLLTVWDKTKGSLKNKPEIACVFAGLISVIIIGLLVENLIFRTVEQRTIRKWGMHS